MGFYWLDGCPTSSQNKDEDVLRAGLGVGRALSLRPGFDHAAHDCDGSVHLAFYCSLWVPLREEVLKDVREYHLSLALSISTTIAGPIFFQRDFLQPMVVAAIVKESLTRWQCTQCDQEEDVVNYIGVRVYFAVRLRASLVTQFCILPGSNGMHSNKMDAFASRGVDKGRVHMNTFEKGLGRFVFHLRHAGLGLNLFGFFIRLHDLLQGRGGRHPFYALMASQFLARSLLHRRHLLCGIFLEDSSLELWVVATTPIRQHQLEENGRIRFSMHLLEF